MATKKNITEDRGEPVSLMEPLVLGESVARKWEFPDRALELASRSEGLHRSLPASTIVSLATLVRAMNCYYSNLIEGHDTHPTDIERSLCGDYSADPRKRDLQLEAKAHIRVQEWIDTGGLRGRATSAEGIREIHRRFCAELPEELLWVTHPGSGKRVEVVPGALRAREVQVGRHVPVSPGAVPRFMDRFEQAYSALGAADAILATAAAHHRLLWIHPFIDGNGRVARLMSHAVLRECLNTGGVWSVARGLARNVARYKDLLAACDGPRRGDLDGRGNLSQEALAQFTEFFLTVCIDQVDFMERLLEPGRLAARISIWAEEEARVGALPSHAERLLKGVLRRGEFPRGELAAVAGVGERQARRIAVALVARGVLVSDTPRGPLRIAFPATLAERWLPGLFPGESG